MEYEHLFTARAKSYLSALDAYPSVLANEFMVAINLCALQHGQTLLTIPSSCERVDAYIPSELAIKHIAFETNKELSDLTHTAYCTFDSILHNDNSVDTILSLATLHHCTNDERARFYKEAMRLLRPGGRLIIGDVARGSDQDRWLNIFVHTHNPLGHKGMFWSSDDMALLESCGFSVTQSLQHYTWNFPDTSSMYDFVRKLFYIHQASDETIHNGLRDYLHADFVNHSFQWSLIYFIASRP